MSATQLQELYADELKDLWSANDQMQGIVKQMAEKATDATLVESLKKSAAGIGTHTTQLKKLLASMDGAEGSEHCRGMEGLVREATKHMTSDAPETGELLDLEIIAQYQRMSHYGIAGFGTAAAYAKALGREDDQVALHKIVKDIYSADHYASEFAERAEAAAAGDDATEST